MINRTLGACLGGTTVGGHQGLESFASSLMTPSNFIGGGGSCFPSIVVVALGEPGTPLICCATTGEVATAPTSAAIESAIQPIFMSASRDGRLGERSLLCRWFANRVNGSQSIR